MQISKEKINKIKEDVLSVLYTNSPKMMFTSDIAHETARDEEFIKRLLLEMEKDSFVIGVRKNSNGVTYAIRIRWRLSTKTYDAYKRLEEQKIVYDDIENTYV
jgi:hypothetical protein